jgi:hypothetical protein
MVPVHVLRDGRALDDSEHAVQQKMKQREADQRRAEQRRRQQGDQAQRQQAAADLNFSSATQSMCASIPIWANFARLALLSARNEIRESTANVRMTSACCSIFAPDCLTALTHFDSSVRHSVKLPLTARLS